MLGMMQESRKEWSMQVAKAGGSIAGNARKEIEEKTGKSVISSKNAAEMSKLIEDVVREPMDKL